MTIAPEGYYIVGGVLAITISGTLLLGGHSWPLWIIFILIAQFFREPVRNIVANVDDIVSPADGRVVFIGRATSPANGKESLKISVFMNVFNVHANRSPVAGAVMRSQRFPGSFFNASLDKASEENERHLIEIDGKHGKIACMQIAGLLARRVLCHTNVGDTLSIGQRYGFIRFGSRADVYLPLNISPTVALGDSVVAGITRIAAPTT
ncbi:MAG: phosphatidylserine decarboxylase [Gammaproteobacteria bacterium WSBS_2016_MAG_OTU1]